MSEELIEMVLIFIIAGALLAMIILFLMNVRLTSGLFGNMFWIRAGIEALLAILGIRGAF